MDGHDSLTRLKMTPTTESSNVSPFFKMRRASRFAAFDTAGYWSYPAFLPDSHGKIFWLHLILPAVKSRSGSHALFKPKALVVTLPNSSVVVRYENFRVGRDPNPALPWDKPLALLPHRAIADLPKTEWAKRERALLHECENSGATFLHAGKLPDLFKHEYLTLQNPVVLPWLRQLCPAFMAALEVESKGEQSPAI